MPDFVPLPRGDGDRALGRLYKYAISSATQGDTGTYRVTVTDVRSATQGATNCVVRSESKFSIGSAIIEKQPKSQFLCSGNAERVEVQTVSKNVTCKWVKWLDEYDQDPRNDRQIINALPRAEFIRMDSNYIENPSRTPKGKAWIELNPAVATTYRALLVSNIPGADTDADADGIPDINIDSDGDGMPDINRTTTGNIMGVTRTNLVNRTCYQISDRFVVGGGGLMPTDVRIVAPQNPPNACSGYPGVPGAPYVYQAMVAPASQQYDFQWNKRVPRVPRVPGDDGEWLWVPIEGASGQSYTIPEATQDLNGGQYSVRISVQEPTPPPITPLTIEPTGLVGPEAPLTPEPNTNPYVAKTIKTKIRRNTDVATDRPVRKPNQTNNTITITQTTTSPTQCKRTSAPVTLVVKPKPRVTLQPNDQAVCRGVAAVFTATVDFGTDATESFEWFRRTTENNGRGRSIMAGTDNAGSSYRLETDPAAAINTNTDFPYAVDEGKYYATLTNTFTGGYFCTANTRDATLTIHPLPTGSWAMDSNPSDDYWCEGKDRRFRIITPPPPSGTRPPYPYVWKEGVGTSTLPLPADAVESTTPPTPSDNYYSGRLTLPRVPLGYNDKQYTVTITDSRQCSAEFVSPALIVKGLPDTPWLDDTRICTGQQATFTARLRPPTTEGGPPPPRPYPDYPAEGNSFIWKREGVDLPPGGAVYTTPYQTAADQVRYTVTVKNGDHCKSTSPSAWLRVTAKPAITIVEPDGNGNCSNAPIRIVAKNGNVPLSDVLFEWSKSLSPPAYEVIPGTYHPSATSNPLVLLPRTPPATWNGYYYKVKAISPENTNCFIEHYTTDALVVNLPPPTPAASLLERPVCEGFPAKFKTPAPTPPLNLTDYHYQWKRHETTQGTPPTITVTNAGTGIDYETPITSSSDNGVSYTVTVTDNATHCKASSLPVLLTVHARPTAPETVSYDPACENEKAVFKIINPVSGIVRRQWEERTTLEGAQFLSIPTADNPTADRRNLEIFPTSGKINYRYRVKSFNAEGCWRASDADAAVLTVKLAPELTLTAPEPVCPGVGASFRVSVSGTAGAATEHKWERKAALPLPPLNGVPQWSNEEETFPENTGELPLVDASRNMLDGTRGRTLTREKDNGSLYKVTVTAANGCKATSRQEALRVFPTPRVDSAPTLSPSPVCSNQPVTIQITNPGGSVQWEEAPPGNPESFAVIPHSNPRNPTDLNAHVVSAPLNGYKYRVKLTANGCVGS